MNTIHRGLLTLLRSALSGQKLSLPADFRLEDAMPLIARQNLHTLAYLGAVNCGLPKSDPILQKLYGQYLRALLRSEQQLQALRKLYAAFEENGIDYMPLKGCNMKPLYPQPELRFMGDADILVRAQQYEQVVPVLQKLGYDSKKEHDYDVAWHSPALYLEAHRMLFGTDQKDLFAYFGDGWAKAQNVSGCRYAMSVEDAYIYIFSHMTKHFRISGIGARQLMDLHVYRCAHPEMNTAAVDESLQKLYLKEFHDNILRTLAVWFADAPEDPVTEQITAYVFGGGSWGNETNRQYAEAAIRNRKREGHERLRSFWNAVFLPLSAMQSSYNVLYKHPWLYPVFVPVRWARILLFKRKRVKKKLSIINGISAEKVNEHCHALEEMGLNYRYITPENED